jgi:hypothetical protein
MDRFFDEKDAKDYAREYLIPKALKKKYYEYTIGYDRYNPQLGTHHHTTTVIAATDTEAVRKGKKFCNGGCYGSNYFTGLEGERKLLTLNVDYILRADVEWKHFSDYKPVVKVEEIYHF